MEDRTTTTQDYFFASTIVETKAKNNDNQTEDNRPEFYY